MKHPFFQTSAWGISVALSWMWGLGLFFSVQFTYQFGLFGLLTFAIPNALGLIVFGLITNHIASRVKGSESLANFFNTWSRPYRLIFYLYQLLAITLTVFAVIRYIWQPMDLEPKALYLPLTVIIILAAGCLFGEEFNIKRIKYSHTVFFIILSVALVMLATALIDDPSRPRIDEMDLTGRTGSPTGLSYWGYAIPMCIGLLLGPWLDLQQWQRAIQARREGLNVAQVYSVGGVLFFALLIIHGLLALWGMNHGADSFVNSGRFDGLPYAQSMLTSYFYEQLDARPLLFATYMVFLGVCLVTTLDSGYVALKWFLWSNLRSSKRVIFSIIPEWLVVSPIPSFLFAGLFSLFAAIVQLELEYYMIFYATFFVGYATLGITRCYQSPTANTMPQVKMFMIGSLAVVIFAYGYFLKIPLFQIFASLLPLGYVAWLIFKPESSAEFLIDRDKLDEPSSAHRINANDEEDEDASSSPTTTAVPISPALDSTIEPSGAKPTMAAPDGYFEGKWFVHTFMATYADTNSVGNVYFGMYAMWVGKTRELFFNKCLPKFNIKTSPYYILTRSFQHKFVRETHEFEQVRVQIRIGNFNRKFVTLLHEVYDSKQKLLGKGEQSLMFVDSANYHLIDIPDEVYQAFIAYA